MTTLNVYVKSCFALGYEITNITIIQSLCMVFKCYATPGLFLGKLALF